MAEAFVPLERYLRGEPIEDAGCVAHAESDAPERCDDGLRGEAREDLGALLREVKLFRAALADALDGVRERLLCDIAAEVLARELALSPADVEGVVRNALARLGAGEPLRLRAHASEVVALSPFGLPVVEDARLRSGDVAIELRDGSIDLSLGVRLEGVLAALG